MNIKIDNDKIKKYAAFAIISGAMIVSAGISDINHSCEITDHDYHDCAKSKILNVFGSNEDGIALGMQHRLDEIKKDEDVENAYYGDILIDKYDRKAPEEYYEGSDITFVAPAGYCLEGTWCRSVEPIEQENVGTGIVIEYKDGHVRKIVLDSNNDYWWSGSFNPQDKELVTKATYRETVYYTEAKEVTYEDGLFGFYTDGGVLVKKDGRMLSKQRVLTLKKEND